MMKVREVTARNSTIQTSGTLEHFKSSWKGHGHLVIDSIRRYGITQCLPNAYSLIFVDNFRNNKALEGCREQVNIYLNLNVTLI